MAHQNPAGVIQISVQDVIIDDGPNEEPRYAISVVAARCGIQLGTLRRYEEWGLVQPARTGRQRLYSDADIERIQRIRRLMDDLGINLAGAAAVLHLRQQVISLQREMHALRQQLER
jgi:MerR family transcriptional regulator/heat shock protein HspR